MDNEPVLGEICVRGEMHDGRYDEKDRNFFSIVGFLPGKFREVFIKRANSEKHLLPIDEEELNKKTVISSYVRVNSETIGGILERTEKKYERMKKKYEGMKEKYENKEKKDFEDHLHNLRDRLDYLERIKSEERKLIELIGGGAIEDREYSDLVIRELESFLIMPSYRVMEFGTKRFIDLTETAYWLNGVPTDIMTFRTANPWLIQMMPRFRDAGYNYVLAGESPRKDGKGEIVQYMLFLQVKDEFEELLYCAEKRCPVAHDVLKPFSDAVIGFMDEGIEKISIGQLKEQYALLEAFPKPEQFENGEKTDYDDIKQYIEVFEDTYTPEHKVAYRAASIALNTEGRYDFLPEHFRKLIGTLDLYRCRDLEEFEMHGGLPLHAKEEYDRHALMIG